DGLRFGIMAIAPQGQDIRFSEDRVEHGRNFCNKLWNACRFRQMQGATDRAATVDTLLSRMQPADYGIEDEAMLQQLIRSTRQVQKALDEYDLSSAAQILYHVFWNDFCDWYVEVSKGRLQD